MPRYRRRVFRAAMQVLEDGRREGHLLTGLPNLDTPMVDFSTTQHIPQRPLMELGESELRLSRGDFAQLMSAFA